MAKTVTKSIDCQSQADAGTLNVAVPARVVSALKSAKEAFFGLCVQTGKEVLATLMEQERTRLCGAKGVPNPERGALRGGHTTSRVTLGGRRIEIRRPRARSVRGAEVSLPSFAWAANRDPLDSHTLDAIAVGVSTRRYARSLDALPQEVVQSSTSKSAVSRRFVALSCERLKVWLSRSLGHLDLPALMIDAIHFRSHIVLGIDTEGRKHVLGFHDCRQQ
jgi:transposase-like protein